MSKYLVTGASGFIGSNIVHMLVEKGEEVVALDINETKNLDEARNDIEFHKNSILDQHALNEAVKDVDYILHQAAVPSVPKSVKDPFTTTNTNVIGTLNVLIAAKENKVKRVVLASSSSVYGDTQALPKHEGMQPSPISPYGISKYVNELHAKNFYELYGLETVCLRYFNVFGPRQDPNSQYAAVIPKFITLIAKNESPVVFGDGSATRDFSFVKDVVRANLLATVAKKEACGKVFNIAGGKKISINELVALINKIAGKNVKAKYEKERPGDIKHSYANISLAEKLLGFKPEYDVEKGLRETIEWYKTHQW